MNENDRLQKLIDWVRAKNGRNVEVNIGEPSNNNTITIWAYDYNLRTGEHLDINHLEDIDKLDLEGMAREERKQKFEALKAEFGEAAR